MKVCHITSVHNANDIRILSKECSSLAHNGYEVYLVQEGNSFEKLGVHCVGFGEKEKNRFKRIFFTSKKAYQEAIKVDADIYHLHDPELLLFALKLKKKKKKVIFDSHENYTGCIQEKTYLNKPIATLISKIYGMFERYICHRIDGVIVVSDDLKKYFEKINQNTVTVSNFPFFKNSTSPQFISNDFVFAGNVARQWNLDCFVRALWDIPDAKFLVLGEADDSFVKEIRALPCGEQVEFKGKVSHDEVQQIMSRCIGGIALLSPGLNTNGKKGTMGNTKIFEQMMVGLPVICTDFEYWKEFIEGFKCGFCVDPYDELMINGAIKKIIEDKEEAKQMGLRGKKLIEEKYNWRNEEFKLLEFYRKLCF